MPRILPPVHGPTLRRMLWNPTWTRRLIFALAGWGWWCLRHGQRPTICNVPLTAVLLWPGPPQTADEARNWNVAIERMISEATTGLARLRAEMEKSRHA